MRGEGQLPPNFADIKLGYLQRIKDEVQAFSLPLDLIMNFDQTNSKLVPVSDWTLKKEGSKQVAIVGKEDKREVTVLLTVTALQKSLPEFARERPQVAMQRLPLLSHGISLTETVNGALNKRCSNSLIVCLSPMLPNLT